MTRYSQVIYDHIVGCGLFMVFFTANSVQSQFVLDEVHTARDENKLIFPINLDGVRLPGELKLRLSAVEQLIRENHTEYAFQVKLRESLSAFRGEAKPLSESEAPSVPAAAKSSVKPAPAVAAPALKKEAPAVPKQVKVGDYIKFGRYPQSGKEPEPIEWRVLWVKNDRALIISRYALDNLKYHSSNWRTIWSNSDMRSWLHDEFMPAAFSADDQKRILTFKMSNPDNPDYGTTGGMPTEDKIFCLSFEEAEKLFVSSRVRIAWPTAYAKRGMSHNGSCWWWLRSPGCEYTAAAYVGIDGSINYDGANVTSDGGFVRPALYISL